MLTLDFTLRLRLFNLKAILCVFVIFKLLEEFGVYDCRSAPVDHMKEVEEVFID